MSSLLFYIIMICLLLLWEIEILIRFSFAYHNTRGKTDHIVSTRSLLLIRLARQLTGFRVIMDTDTGNPLPHKLLFISNHQSLLDIAILVAAFPNHKLRFVAKKQLAHWFPAISPILRMQTHALIDRKQNFSEGKKKLDRLGKQAASSDVSPTIFPEGTRSKSIVLGTFNAGAVRTIQKSSELPTAVCAIDGGLELGKFHNLFHLKNRIYRIKLLTVLPAPQNKDEVVNQLGLARELIQQELNTWNNK
ncbi:lysophospholipid acyltransferase family protein [Spirochaeta dissipatitropha]